MRKSSGLTRAILVMVASMEAFAAIWPVGAFAGPSYVQALNPPFVPFASSGNGPGGAFDPAATPAATPSKTPRGATRTPSSTPTPRRTPTAALSRLPTHTAARTPTKARSLTPTATPTPMADFANPQRVTIAGYSGDAMEPFITRDGRMLFFNNSNQSADTDLYWAVRVDDLNFQFRGEIGGVNSSSGLDAVASMDVNNHFYFVSTRSYPLTLSTIYRGVFSDGAVSAIALVPGVSMDKPGWVNFDAEISADGNTLYFVDGFFATGSVPQSAKIVIARRAAGGFVRDPASDAILDEINTNTLNYAPDTAADEREIFFTRLDRTGPAIYMASRAGTSQRFGTPRKISAITGFAEAPSIAPDARSLYYHHNDGGVFNIYRVTR